MIKPTAQQSNKPACLRDDALAVLMRLRENGHIAYFAGGCVRDELLGLTPKDYDIATDAPPDRVRKLFTNTQAVGAAFGVILVRQRKSVVEVATFRTDGTYIDGRRPEAVMFTTAEEDAKRRDFTINGLFLDPIENRVIDYVGGQEDLQNRVLRAIGDADHRFEEDHLRMLRAVRFAARFELTVDPSTENAIIRHAEQLKRISPERIADELRMMLGEPSRIRAWPMLWRLRMIDVIFRHLPSQNEEPLAPQRSILRVLSPEEPLEFGEVLAAAILCYRWQRTARGDIRQFLGRRAAVEAANAMRQALRISNDEVDQLREILESLESLLGDPPPTIAMKKRFLARRYHPAAMEVLEAIGEIGLLTDRIGPLYAELYQLYEADVAPPPLITGDDLTDAGLMPGPKFKIALDRTYDAQLEGRITTRQEAIEMAIRIASGEPG
ncbi:MAG TPA: CCA tRNA nucleotidyltransferase [Tepidisphaeraceae bacterium]|nr:CCA tRNA nucleotidyltransferase [Tepidisphaeraceae bacterium]